MHFLVVTNKPLIKPIFMQVVPLNADTKPGSPRQIGDASYVLQWLRSLGLSKYEEAFVKEEIDWETLHWLTEEVCFMSLQELLQCTCYISKGHY